MTCNVNKKQINMKGFLLFFRKGEGVFSPRPQNWRVSGGVVSARNFVKNCQYTFMAKLHVTLLKIGAKMLEYIEQLTYRTQN